MEDMENLLKSMTQMRDGMEAVQKELASYSLRHEEEGISVEIQGDGLVKNLEFAVGTPASSVEKALNNANSRVKDYITKRMNAVTPVELRDAK
ncbi:MAG: hypothetical protein LBR91_03780 [Puniceicoccales bacterium]|nr:hypothetical protein [Puniceicoccales bacterium]